LGELTTVYPNKTDVFGFYEPKTAQKIYELSRRSTENDLENLYGNITSSGELTNGDCQNCWRNIGIKNENMPIIKIKTFFGGVNNPSGGVQINDYIQFFNDATKETINKK
jgi:hypothetical protein